MKLLRLYLVLAAGIVSLTLSGCNNIKSSKKEISSLIDDYVKYSAVFFSILNDKKKSKIIENGDTSSLSKEELDAANRYLRLFAEQTAYESTTAKMIWFGNIVGYQIKNINIYGNKAITVIQARAKSALKFSDTPDEYKFIFHLRYVASKWRIQSIEAAKPISS